MQRIIVVAIALALSPLAAAQLYKYVDKDGKTVYSDQPPPNTASKQVNVQSGPAAAPAAGPKSAVEKDKDLEKSRKEAREKQDKQAKAAQKDQEAEQRCAQARTAFQSYSDGGRLYKYNDKGERVFMDDAEIEAARERSRKDMDEACKKG
jgi:molecular chaperone GrpE (heat shock protein)